MPTVIITGASRGLGLEFARQYAGEGWRVVAACRRPDQADDLAGIGRGVEVRKLDVRDLVQINALAKGMGGEPVDLLINNAGIYGPRDVALGAIDYEAWEEVLRVNVLGPLRVAESLLENVAASEHKKMAFLSSRMGSMGENRSGGSYIYRSSKAALNAVVKSLAIDLAPRGIACLALHPGWARTDMGGPEAEVTAHDGVAGLRQVIAAAGPERSGRFVNYDGAAIAW